MRFRFVIGTLFVVILAGPPAHGAYGVGILQTGDHPTSIDSVYWTLRTAPFPVWERTEEWEGGPGVADTFLFQVPEDWPLSGVVHYSVNGGPDLTVNANPLVADTWYELPVSLPGAPDVNPRVMFQECLGVAVESPVERILAGRFEAKPNPFADRTRLSMDLAAAGPVRLAVFDVTGREVRILVDRVLPAGRHEFAWDRRDDCGRVLAPGVYLVRWSGTGRGDRVRLVVLDR